MPKVGPTLKWVDTEVGAVEIDPQERGDGWVRGEILATGFSNLGMPFLRYRTGDVATLRMDPPESVSRGRPVIDAIDGRIEDYVVTPDGRRVGRMDHAFKNARALRELQIVQKTPEAILLRVVPAEAFNARARSEIEGELRSRLGHQIRIDFESRRYTGKEALQEALLFEQAALDGYRDLLEQVDGCGDVILEEFARQQVSVESEHVSELKMLLGE